MAVVIVGIVDEGLPGFPQTPHPVVWLEECALRRWLRGDPDGFLEISSDDVVYFDPYTERRIDGKVALTAYYELIRGKVHTRRYEIINPLVQAAGEAAVLERLSVTCDRQPPMKQMRHDHKMPQIGGREPPPLVVSCLPGCHEEVISAVTYNFNSYGGNEDALRWNCTEVY